MAFDLKCTFIGACLYHLDNRTPLPAPGGDLREQADALRVFFADTSTPEIAGQRLHTAALRFPSSALVNHAEMHHRSLCYSDDHAHWDCLPLLGRGLEFTQETGDLTVDSGPRTKGTDQQPLYPTSFAWLPDLSAEVPGAGRLDSSALNDSSLPAAASARLTMKAGHVMSFPLSRKQSSSNDLIPWTFVYPTTNQPLTLSSDYRALGIQVVRKIDRDTLTLRATGLRPHVDDFDLEFRPENGVLELNFANIEHDSLLSNSPQQSYATRDPDIAFLYPLLDGALPADRHAVPKIADTGTGDGSPTCGGASTSP